MIDFRPLNREHEERIWKRAQQRGFKNRLEFSMDMAAANAVCPLDTGKLLAFPDLDFFHDLFGIRDCINRTTGQLDNCFVPRCADRRVQE